MSKHINPFTDFGFRKLFGEESCKDILISFLNALLMPKSPIKKLTFTNTFKLGNTKYDRSLIYDLYCENEKGEKFYIEMQKAEQEYFADRMVFYSTFPIQEQAPKGKWNYELKAVYCVGILDFTLKDIKNNNYVNEMKIKNQDNQIFYDKYNLITVEMPKFTKKLKELKTLLDKWLYFLKNLESLDVLPALFKEDVFKEASKKTERANFTKAEQAEYEKSLKTQRDEYSVVTTAHNQGIAKGRIQGEEIGIKKGEEMGIKKGEEIGNIRLVIELNALKVSQKIISQKTGLKSDKVKAILNLDKNGKLLEEIYNLIK